MKITDIKQQVKMQGRYSIFVDGKFSFGLNETTLMASDIRIGRKLTNEELAQLKDTAKTEKAYNQALGMIARRSRSEWEMREYLKRKEYDPELIDELVERLYMSKWLNDEDFARKWVDNRRLLKATSKRRLTQELKAKRVSDDIIQSVLAEDETDEITVLRELVVRKAQQTRYQDTQKLMAYLIRQGFNYADIKSVLTDTT
jgi:regulatory protein